MRLPLLVGRQKLKGYQNYDDNIPMINILNSNMHV